jgi:hypothetical protein
LDELEAKLSNIIKEKENAKIKTEKIKEDTENIQVDMTKAIVDLNDKIELNRKKETEIMKEIREVANKVVDLEVKIKKRKEEMKLNGIELKNEEEEEKKEKKKTTKEDEKIDEGSNNNNTVKTKNEEVRKENSKK